ncbi:hypothetical protein SAMN05444392_11377 [Seinonella peptonophila]|uniref:Uncharacterized protein n=1 Tax=Seinonella peptonophila TaxID=112248 RepID=A0A1M5AFM5_9BACL|nr:hypothetical protein [Seinonella peptonophila]SHF28906.1 hypothetical protein SAMN05444392_11377 [Seinonella peptonophila]
MIRWIKAIVKSFSIFANKESKPSNFVISEPSEPRAISYTVDDFKHYTNPLTCALFGWIPGRTCSTGLNELDEKIEWALQLKKTAPPSTQVYIDTTYLWHLLWKKPLSSELKQEPFHSGKVFQIEEEEEDGCVRTTTQCVVYGHIYPTRFELHIDVTIEELELPVGAEVAAEQMCQIFGGSTGSAWLDTLIIEEKARETDDPASTYFDEEVIRALINGSLRDTQYSIYYRRSDGTRLDVDASLSGKGIISQCSYPNNEEHKVRVTRIYPI